MSAEGRLSGWAKRGIPAALLLSCFLAFAPALGGEFLDFDDDELIVGNQHYRGLDAESLGWMFTTSRMGHYQPLTWFSYAIDDAIWRMGGAEPASEAPVYHRTNVFLHALTAIAVYLLGLRLLAGGAADAGRAAIFGAAVAAGFFALHPLRVESVAWVTERRDVLSGLFFVLAVHAYVRWSQRGQDAEAGAWRGLAIVWLFATISLFAKAWGIVLPAVLLILDAWPLGRLSRAGVRRCLVEKLPFFATSALFAALAAWAQGTVRQSGQTLAEHTIVERLAQGAYGLVYYPWKTLVPSGLLPIHDLPDELALSDARFLVPFLLVLGVTAALVVVRRRVPAVLAAWVAFAVIVSPVLGVLQTGIQLVADRYSYLACIPFALLVGAGFQLGWTRAAGARGPLAGLALGAVLLLGALGGLSARSTQVWATSDSLWQHAFDANPQSWRIAQKRGLSLQRQALGLSGRERIARLEEAREVFTAGLEGGPRSGLLSNLGIVHGHLAEADPSQRARHRGQELAFARRALDRAVATDAPVVQLRVNLGIALAKNQQFADARAQLEEAFALDASRYEVLYNLGLMRELTQDPRGAIEVLEQAAALRPEVHAVWMHLGNCWQALGQRERAAEAYREVLALRPGNAQAQRALAALQRP